MAWVRVYRSRRLSYMILAAIISLYAIQKLATIKPAHDDAMTHDAEDAIEDTPSIHHASHDAVSKKVNTFGDSVRSIFDKATGWSQTISENSKHVVGGDLLKEDEDEAENEDEDKAPEEGTEDSDSSVAVDAHDESARDDGIAPWAPKKFYYRQIFSLTSRDRKFIPIYFGGTKDAYNPNIIPHPTNADMWIVVAQHLQTQDNVAVSEQLVCPAGFFNGVLLCAEDPKVLPVTSSLPGHCEGDLAYFNFRNGPRDARMFYGPDVPYLVYGSQASYTCLGLWLHDVRMLLDAFRIDRYLLVRFFKKATELRRATPFRPIEKNFFIFWDFEGKAYVHYDIGH